MSMLEQQLDPSGKMLFDWKGQNSHSPSHFQESV